MPWWAAAWEAEEGQGVVRDARSQARRIGASQVLWESTWSRTRHGMVPMVHSTPGSSVTTHGPYGPMQASTPGTTNINLVSYAYDIFDYLVLFLTAGIHRCWAGSSAWVWAHLTCSCDACSTLTI